MNMKIYIKYIVILVLLLGYWSWQNCYPQIKKWGDKKAQILIERGNIAADNGRRKDALNMYNLAILLGGKRNDAWAHNCRGIIYWKRYAYGNKKEIWFKKALADYNRAQELAGSCYAAVLCNKGLLYATKGEGEKALDFFDEAIKCNPKDYKIYEEKSSALFDMGRYREAIEFGKNALEKIGQSDDIYFDVAYSYEMLGDYKKAIEYYDMELKFNHYQSWWTFTNASYCKLMLKDYKGAIEYAENSIKLHKNNIHPYNFIAFAALETGDLELAVKYNNYAFNVYENPNYLTYYNYARIKHLQGDNAGAKSRLAKARKLFEKDTQNWQFEGFENLCDELAAKL